MHGFCTSQKPSGPDWSLEGPSGLEVQHPQIFRSDIKSAGNVGPTGQGLNTLIAFHYSAHSGQLLHCHAALCGQEMHSDTSGLSSLKKKKLCRQRYLCNCLQSLSCTKKSMLLLPAYLFISYCTCTLSTHSMNKKQQIFEFRLAYCEVPIYKYVSYIPVPSPDKAGGAGKVMVNYAAAKSSPYGRNSIWLRYEYQQWYPYPKISLHREAYRDPTYPYKAESSL